MSNNNKKMKINILDEENDISYDDIKKINKIKKNDKLVKKYIDLYYDKQFIDIYFNNKKIDINNI